jgi:phospholipid transport system substrate-binding protein
MTTPAIHRRDLLTWACALALGGLSTTPAWSQAGEGPDALIQRIAADVIAAVKADPAIQAGDINKVIALVDAKVMPHVNFTRMTASAVGRFWRQATPEQKQRLLAEFKTLLVRTYSGALAQVKEQTLRMKPSRASANDPEVVVRSEVAGKGDPIQMDYRLEKTDAGWKIYDVNVMGVWLVQNYRGQFEQEINAKGLEGLIASLSQRNRSNAAEKPVPAKG